MAYLKDCWPNELLQEIIRQIKEESLFFSDEENIRIINLFLELDKLMTEKYFKYLNIKDNGKMEFECV